MELLKKKTAKVSPTEEVGDTRGIDNPMFGIENANHVA